MLTILLIDVFYHDYTKCLRLLFGRARNGTQIDTDTADFHGLFYELSARIRPIRVYPRPILFLYFRACTRVIVIQAKAIKTVLKMNSQRYWSPNVSTITPPSVGPNTAANCEEK